MAWQRRAKPTRRSRSGWIPRLVVFPLLVLIGYYASCAFGLLYLKWLPPLSTSVHVQRRVESFFKAGPYSKRYTWTPMNRISRDLRHAVVAAEDSRFYQHHGFDWEEIQQVSEEYFERGRSRGASTITQQLVKNLFLTTHRSPIRKALELPLVPMAEFMLSKERILELYLNVVEWGPGVYGAEAAARYHYRTPAADLSRDQAVRLAACLPAPLSRKPARMNGYSGEIQRRMRRMGW